MIAPTPAIRRCIARSMRDQDGRGAAQAERLCAAEIGGSSIDRNTAAAARRFGEWLGALPTYHPGRENAATARKQAAEVVPS